MDGRGRALARSSTWPDVARVNGLEAQPECRRAGAQGIVARVRINEQGVFHQGRLVLPAEWACSVHLPVAKGLVQREFNAALVGAPVEIGVEGGERKSGLLVGQVDREATVSEASPGQHHEVEHTRWVSVDPVARGPEQNCHRPALQVA